MNNSPKNIKQTHTQIIFNHLLSGATINRYQASDLYNITSLPQRIYDLRTSGLDVQSEMTRQNDRCFSLYWIDETTLFEMYREVTV